MQDRVDDLPTLPFVGTVMPRHAIPPDHVPGVIKDDLTSGNHRDPAAGHSMSGPLTDDKYRNDEHTTVLSNDVSPVRIRHGSDTQRPRLGGNGEANFDGPYPP